MSLVRVKFITVSRILPKMKVVCREVANLLIEILHYTTHQPITGFGINNSEAYIQRVKKE